MPTALKASWTVSWGVVPLQPDGSKTLYYTSEDYAKDQAEDWQLGDLSIFERMQAEANFLAMHLQNPKDKNWVTLEWVWY